MNSGRESSGVFAYMEIDMLTYHTNDNAPNHFSLSSLWYRFGLVIMNSNGMGSFRLTLRHSSQLKCDSVYRNEKIFIRKIFFNFIKVRRKKKLEFTSNLCLHSKYKISMIYFPPMMQLFSITLHTGTHLKRLKWACDIDVFVWDSSRQKSKISDMKKRN